MFSNIKADKPVVMFTVAILGEQHCEFVFKNKTKQNKKTG